MRTCILVEVVRDNGEEEVKIEAVGRTIGDKARVGVHFEGVLEELSANETGEGVATP